MPAFMDRPWQPWSEPEFSLACMTLAVHPSHPQPRAIAQAARVLAGGGVAACPTDACYSLVCMVADKAATDRIRAVPGVAPDHVFALLCRDESEVAQYAKISNAAYRLLRRLTPGPYTFILPATKETPRRLQDGRRRQVGVRVPGHPCVSALLAALGAPLLSATLVDAATDLPYAEPEDLVRDHGHALDVCLASGNVGVETTTVIDLTESAPRLVRQGAGDVSAIGDLA